MLLCANNTAMVSWQQSPGAVSYNVTAVGGNGDVKQCTSNTTTCLIPNMSCAQTYSITVSPFSNQYKGQDSQPFSYVSGKTTKSKKKKRRKFILKMSTIIVCILFLQAPVLPQTSSRLCSAPVTLVLWPGTLPRRQICTWHRLCPLSWTGVSTTARPAEQAAPLQAWAVETRSPSLWSPWTEAARANPATKQR